MGAAPTTASPSKTENRSARFGPPTHPQRHVVDSAYQCPWRDLFERCGLWGTVASRFYYWRKAGIWQRLFKSIQQQADAAGKMNWTVYYIDGAIVRVHQHAAVPPKGPSRSLSTTLLLSDFAALNPVRIVHGYDKNPLPHIEPSMEQTRDKESIWQTDKVVLARTSLPDQQKPPTVGRAIG